MSNKITIFGTTTRDAELRYSKDGSAHADIGVACNVGWGDKEETICFS